MTIIKDIDSPKIIAKLDVAVVLEGWGVLGRHKMESRQDGTILVISVHPAPNWCIKEFHWLTYRKMDEELLTKVKMTHRQLSYLSMSNRSWKLEPCRFQRTTCKSHFFFPVHCVGRNSNHQTWKQALLSSKPLHWFLFP